MTITFEKVLVAIKPGQSGLPLSAYHARVLAEKLGAKLRVVSCAFESQVATGVLNEDAQAVTAQAGLMEAERKRLEELGRSLGEWGGTVDTIVRWGHPMQDVILAEAREWDADLLVIGAHGHEPSPRPRLSDIDWRVMERSPCPLLVVKSPNFAGYSRILAGIDPLHRHAGPSGLDDAVLEVASALAKPFESDLSVIHAYPSPEAFELVSAVEVSPGVFYGSENIEDVHRRAVLALMEAHGLSPGQAHLEPGSPEEVILDQARRRGAKLVVIGAIKRGWLEHALLGSTAEKVAADIDCDVLLVGGDE
jgi:universal stress protein E